MLILGLQLRFGISKPQLPEQQTHLIPVHILILLHSLSMKAFVPDIFFCSHVFSHSFPVLRNSEQNKGLGHFFLFIAISLSVLKKKRHRIDLYVKKGCNKF